VIRQEAVMSVVYWARFFREESGGFSVDVPDMPGCFTGWIFLRRLTAI